MLTVVEIYGYHAIKRNATSGISGGDKYVSLEICFIAKVLMVRTRVDIPDELATYTKSEATDAIPRASLFYIRLEEKGVVSEDFT